MSRPPLDPKKTTAGITVDPQTLERVIPESKRPDGTVRKQIKIRPGFTPQEDVRRFRGTKQTQMDVNTLPKGHIIGWAPPPTSTSMSPASKLSKSAIKNAKRKAKKTGNGKVPDNRENDKKNDDDESGQQGRTPVTKHGKVPENWEEDDKKHDGDESGQQDPDSSTPENWEDDNENDDDESGQQGLDVTNSSTTIRPNLPADDREQPVSSAKVENDLSSNLDKLNVK